jgi:peptidylprolyl isomerase
MIAACAAIALAGCGGSDSSSTGTSDSSTASTANAGATTEGGRTIAGKTKPAVSVPDGAPPQELVVNDLEEGDGAEAGPDSRVTILYVGRNWSGLPYSNSWRYPDPPSFDLNTEELIPGLIEGLQGMKVGGRREIIVPTSLQYPPGVEHLPLRPSRDTIVFVVDLLGVE